MSGRWLVIVGPTAVGKTEVGIKVAAKFGGEIISADSMQVYRYMDIGTAKPSISERCGIPHHLIDIVDPDEPFSVADFQRLALVAISDIEKRGKVPVVVGGTGLYVKALTEGYYLPEMPSDPGVRLRLEGEAAMKGTAALYRRLQEIDPMAASKIHVNDMRRIVRALEVWELTGERISTLQGSRLPNQGEMLVIGLYMDRALLYQRINERVDRMIRVGLVNEVLNLLRKGYSPKLNSMRSLGYREVTDYLYGRSTLFEAVRLLKRNTRHFAKRQYIWFRKQPRIIWLDAGDYNVEKIVEEISILWEGK